MKQLLIALFVIGLGAFTAQAQEGNPNAPKFNFSDLSHDFGTIPEGPKAVYEFEFTNTGKEPLIIQNVSASCGCTSPYWPKQPILPGKTGKIKVEYNTERRVGPFTKQIYILSNAENPDGKERFELEIKGTVEEKKDDAKAG